MNTSSSLTNCVLYMIPNCCDGCTGLVEDVSSACDHLCRGILVSVTNQATAAKAPINPLKQLRDASRDLDRQLDVIKTLK